MKAIRDDARTISFAFFLSFLVIPGLFSDEKASSNIPLSPPQSIPSATVAGAPAVSSSALPLSSPGSLYPALPSSSTAYPSSPSRRSSASLPSATPAADAPASASCLLSSFACPPSSSVYAAALSMATGGEVSSSHPVIQEAKLICLSLLCIFHLLE